MIHLTEVIRGIDSEQTLKGRHSMIIKPAQSTTCDGCSLHDRLYLAEIRREVGRFCMPCIVSEAQSIIRKIFDPISTP